MIVCELFKLWSLYIYHNCQNLKSICNKSFKIFCYLFAYLSIYSIIICKLLNVLIPLFYELIYQIECPVAVMS